MSLITTSNIFKKSNIFYIPLSITIAHTLNFIVNSPLSTCKEFPPKLPSSVYSSIFFTPLLLFILLAFEPIQTRKRFYTLLSIALIFISIPISFRKSGYSFNRAFISMSSLYGLKMLLFLKLNRTYSKSDQKKEFKSYLWSMFNWRHDSYIIPPKKSNDSNEKENPLIIKSPTTSQINKKSIDRFIIIIAKCIMFELALFISSRYVTVIPKKAYQFRLLEFITKGILPITTSLILKYLNHFIYIYIWMSLSHDINLFLASIFYRLFFHSTSEKNHLLIKFGILNISEYVSLNEWFVTYLFNTKHLLNEPWMSSSPRDFWSNRWQLLLKEIFKELGYLPARNFFSSYFSRRISSMFGILNTFIISALLHEYLIIGNFDIWTGETSFFFIGHGIILILWEIIFGYEDKIKITKIRKFLKWLLYLIIHLLLLPAFAEPSKSSFKLSDYPSFFAKYYTMKQ